MILLDLKQGSPEWHRARLGIPTASQFARILTPTGKPSSAAERYLHELIAERLLGEQVVDYESDEMHRGTELESQAVAWYELQRDVDAQRAGFCLTDDRLCGCSPDRLIGEDGGLELKTPTITVHVGYLLDSVGAKFTPQVQGCLWITGRQWWDLVSFNPMLPSSVVRVERDEPYIERLAGAVKTFCACLDAQEQALLERYPEMRERVA